MKKNLLFSTLLLMTFAVACNKEQIKVSSSSSSAESYISAENSNHGCGDHSYSNALVAEFFLANQDKTANEFEDLLITNTSSHAVSYLWDFGNGDKSTQATPTYHYVMHGSYTITLTATDIEGNIKKASQGITINCIDSSHK